MPFFSAFVYLICTAFFSFLQIPFFAAKKARLPQAAQGFPLSGLWREFFRFVPAFRRPQARRAASSPSERLPGGGALENSFR